MINKQEVDQMARFMRALDPTTSASVTTQAPTAVPASESTATREMKLVLERFHKAAGGAVAQVTAQATDDPELREALSIEPTARGTRIGAWEIQVREDGARRFFSVVEQGGATIASDLLLYEAAHGLVRLLNAGGRLNSLNGIRLLRLEQQYAGALNDAVVSKHYLVKNPRDPRAAVFEARYSAAKDRAITARDQLIELAARY